MTLLQDLHKELWQWLADNPKRDKWDWPGWHRNEVILLGQNYHYCFACLHARRCRDSSSHVGADGYHRKSSCHWCPLYWGKQGCERSPTSHYAKWVAAKRTLEMAHEVMSRDSIVDALDAKAACAREIANMPWTNTTVDMMSNPDYINPNTAA